MPAREHGPSAIENQPANDAADAFGQRRPERGRIARAWLWVACWVGVIWVLGGDEFSLAETSRTIYPWLEWLIGDVDPGTRFKIFLAIRKSAHFVEYAILAILTFRAALLAASRNHLATAGWVALFLVATLATADEARQALSNTRSGSPYDVAIDVLGGALSIVGLIVITRRMHTAPESSA
ncbi:MAG: VanZ family protein [bacterium]|nr:VanZ family protein [bacterium]